MNTGQTPVGVGEIARNSRVLLGLTTLFVIWQQFLTSGAIANYSSGAVAPISLLAFVASIVTGATVLLKAPYGMERGATLDEAPHRGISLFYGVQIGSFVVGIAVAVVAHMFG